MKVRVLGCYGSETLNYKTTCLLFDDIFSIDAGAITSTLSIEEQAKILSVLITHSHFDHIKDLPFLIDNVFGMKERPLEIYGKDGVMDILTKHVFNDVVWPDFSKIPHKKKPAVKYFRIPNSDGFKINHFEVNIIPVNHTVETVGVRVSSGNSSIIISSDTGPTEMLWKIANKTKNLKAVFVETSFPNSLQNVADASLHLTPNSLKEELTKLKKDVPVFVYHLKPRFLSQIEEELRGIKDTRVQLLQQGSLLEF